MFNFRRWATVFVALCMLLAPALLAQVTTGNIAGTVSAKQDNNAMPGVTVEAVHVPTGTRYSTVSGANGYYQIPNARIGGPYRVTANLEGFKSMTADNVEVRLGQTTNVPLTLGMAAVSEAITVTASTDPIINPNRTGSESAVSTKQIETLPTVNRTLQDYARTNPYISVDPQDASSTRLYIAGRNNRYNNIQIDGAVNNDLFGLADTGTPGGQTNANPISLDAIQQLQLVVSPYDVRQGGFTGGGINAVTRSGTNQIEGSLFGTKRSPSYVGKSVPNFPRGSGIVEKPITTFDQTQYGGRLGGAILRDKLFFFTSGERNRRNEPTGVSADGSTATVFTNPNGNNAAQFRQDLITRYNYDPGTLGDFPRNTNSNLFFGRFDVNLGNSSQVTLRHNYVKGINDTVSNRSATQYRFPTAIYTIADKTNSTVGQWNTVFNATMFNEFRLGHQTIKDIRNVPVVFPSIEIGGTPQSSPNLSAGTERFSGANALDQKIDELTDDFTLTRGNHTIVLGTHNEAFRFKNLFLSEFYGYYYYPTLARFESGDCTNLPAGQTCEYRISYATGSNPRNPTSFAARQYGLYVNDQWHMNNNITLTFGVRADRPSFPDTPSFNPTVQSTIGFSTASKPHNTTVLSPRFGFNWQPVAGGTQQVRGGVGIFAGRAPYVWISNAYGGTGVFSVALACVTSAGCKPPAFNPDPNAQPKGLGSTGSLSVDMVDPNFKFPRVLRGTLGYDRDLFFGIRGTVEALYSKSQEDVYYTNVNRKQTGTSALDGRPTYALVNSQVFDATMLTNTSKGSESIQTIQLNRPFARGVTLSASYAHQNAKSAFDATSSRAISNWRFQHTQGDIFTPTLGRSAFEVEHRLNASASYNLSTGPLNHTLGLYWNAQSGRPYSLLFSSDINKDQYSSNDLLYIPGGADKFILCPSNATAPTATSPCGSRTALDTNLFQQFISSTGLNPNKARILNKYESREPWSRELDFHYALELPVRFVRTEIDADVLNLLHLISKDYGNVYFVSNQNTSPVAYVGQDAASGKPIYREGSTTFDSSGNRTLGSLTPNRQFSVADLRSRWQARVGLRLSF